MTTFRLTQHLTQIFSVFSVYFLHNYISIALIYVYDIAHFGNVLKQSVKTK